MTHRLATLTLLATLALTGCNGFGGAEGGTTGADGSIVQVALSDREGPVNIAGDSLDGESLDIADLRGGVIVLNVWGSWCAPCRAEAPRLQEASETLDAKFIGLSFEDTPGNARAFEDEFSITYPTVIDEEGVLALGRYAPAAAPTTYVLDRQGRVAAVLPGEVRSIGTLKDLVDEVAAETSP